MNLLGKILVFVVMVMCLVFMTLAVTLYATHTNWRDAVMRTESAPGKEVGLKKQLEDEKHTTQALKDEKDKLDADRTAEKSALKQQLAKAESERDAQKQLNDDLSRKIAEAEKSQHESVAELKSIGETLANMRKEVENTREEIRLARKDRDERAKEVVRVTDELHQYVTESKRLNERSVQLAADLARYREVLTRAGVDPNVSPGPPPVDGVIKAVQGDLVEISIGSDDGLAKGHMLHVVRQAGGVNTYLGKVELIKVDPERAVGRIDPATRKGQVQNGDKVYSRIN